MDQPSLQGDMKGPKPVDTEIPTEDGGYQTYKAAGKLKGKKVSYSSSTHTLSTSNDAKGHRLCEADLCSPQASSSQINVK